MGYESSGSGYFTWRNPNINIEEAVMDIESDGYFSIAEYTAETAYIVFSNMRLYWMEAQSALEKVAEYCNGEFEIQGDSSDDHWKLIFKDGKVSKAKAIISWTEPEEMYLKTALGA